VAEDNLVNQKLAIRLLTKMGHSVTIASSGQEVLDLHSQQHFDLILMDVQMPEMDGLDASSRIRQKEVGTPDHMPIIAMTAHAMTGDRERCIAAGMDGYVSKPISKQALATAIEDLIPMTPMPLQGTQLFTDSPRA
jgi:CheY-like chemotaxis protein